MTVNLRAIFKPFSGIDYKYLIIFFVYQIASKASGMVKVYLIHTHLGASALGVISQIEWLQPLYEIMSEGLLLPLFFVLSERREAGDFNKRISSVLAFSFIALFLFCLVIVSASGFLTSSLEQSIALRQKTAQYVRLESLGSLMEVLNSIFFMIFVILRKKYHIVSLVLLSLIINTASNYLFIANLNSYFGIFSASYAKVCGQFLMLLVYFFMPKDFSILPPKITFDDMKQWFKKYSKSYLFEFSESAVRNFSFVFILLPLFNRVNGMGVFWQSNQFIWGFLLLPALALGMLIKQNVSFSKESAFKNLKGYLLLGCCLSVVFWLVLAPFFPFLIHTITGAQNADEISSFVSKTLIFYVFFVFNSLLNAYFYALGRINFIFYQSFVGAFWYFGVRLFFSPNSALGVAFIFGIPMILVFFLSLFQFYKCSKNLEANPH